MTAYAPTFAPARPRCAGERGCSSPRAWWVWRRVSAYVVVEPTPLTSTALVLLPTPALAESSNSDVRHPGAHRR